MLSFLSFAIFSCYGSMGIDAYWASVRGSRAHLPRAHLKFSSILAKNGLSFGSFTQFWRWSFRINRTDHLIGNISCCAHVLSQILIFEPLIWAVLVRNSSFSKISTCRLNQAHLWWSSAENRSCKEVGNFCIHPWILACICIFWSVGGRIYLRGAIGALSPTYLMPDVG